MSKKIAGPAREEDRGEGTLHRVGGRAEDASTVGPETRRALAAETARAHRLEVEAAQLRRALAKVAELVEVIERSERWRIGGFFVRLYNRLRFRRPGPDALDFMRRAVALQTSAAAARSLLPRELEVYLGEELRQHEERMTTLYAETLSELLQAAGLASAPERAAEETAARSPVSRR